MAELDYSILSTDQQNALKTFSDWWFSKKETTGNRFFKLGGLAGTGKTFLLKYILDTTGLKEDSVLWGAFTGKAALVMNRKGIPATTLHRMIYQIDQEELAKGKLVFYKKPELGENIELIVVDEASMVSEEIHNDLLSYEVPILYIGDYFQLPPVDSNFNLMEERNLNAKLSQIQRQALENPIIKWSMLVRERMRLPLGIEKNTIGRIYFDDIKESSFLNANQIICGKNATRIEANKDMRELLGFEGELPQKGEKLIVTRNNYAKGVINGQHIKLVNDAEKISSIAFNGSYVSEDEEDEWKNFSKVELTEADKKLLELDYQELSVAETTRKMNLELSLLNPFQHTDQFSARCYIPSEYKMTLDEMRSFIQSDYGYVITCHKAQGSEWPNVLVLDDGFGRGEIRDRWLYTAITRASQKLIIGIL